VTNSGRPYAFDHDTSVVPAAIQTFISGEEGASAIAGVLSGRVNPSGRLPAQIPRIVGGAQHLYRGAPLTQTIDKISNQSTDPAFPFGHGLSYGSIDITDATLADPTIPVDDTTTLQATVTNTGTRSSTQVLQVYVSDPVAQVARPLHTLVGYRRVTLEPGQSAHVEFTLSPELASYPGRDLRRRVDPGRLVFSLGTSSRDLLAEFALQVTGQATLVGSERMMTAPSKITRA